MSLADLNRIHQETYQILVKHIEAHGFAPTTRELAQLLGLSSSDSAHQRLQTLEQAGLIERVGPRAIRIVEDRE